MEDIDIDDVTDIESMNDDEIFDLLDEIESQDNLSTDSEGSLDYDSYNYCKNCNSDNYIVKDISNGIVVCSNPDCGTVIRNLFDKSPEWNCYNGEVRGMNRCSMPINKLLPQSSLGTTIASKSRSCRIRVINNWLKMPYKERSLYLVFRYIDERCRKAKLYKCIADDAKILYKIVNEAKHKEGINKGKKKIIRGRNKQSLIAVCVFYACKKRNKTRSQKEIARIFNLRNTDITKGFKTFSDLQENIKMNYNFDYSMPEHFIYRHCQRLHINKKYVEQAIEITKNIQRLKIATEHTPLSVASGTVFLITKLNELSVTKKKIAREFEVSEVTITKVLEKLEL